VDHDRLRRYRLSRAKQALDASQCGALLLFDVNNIRYTVALLEEGVEVEGAAV
jgi:Xaa-Pro aminopeptidase